MRHPVLLQCFLSRNEKDAFKLWCYQNDVTMSQQLRKMIRSHLHSEDFPIQPDYPLLTDRQLGLFDSD